MLDFGISKAPAADELTQDGQIIGTPQYLSPEQIEGTVGNESDQYALGVLLYVCLTQRLPYANFHGVRLLRAISEGKFDPPRTLRADLPEALEAIVLRAMHVEPKQRFDSIHALGQRLWEFASPSGQAQWKTFYFHTPAATQPPKPAMTPNAPQLRELAREAGGGTVPGRRRRRPRRRASRPRGTPAPAPTNRGPIRQRRWTLVSALAKTEPQPSTIGPSNFAVTKTAAASGMGEPTSLSHSDIAGESALSDARDTGSRQRARRVARWRVALAVAGVAAVAVVIQRAWRTSAAGGTGASSVVAGASTPAPHPRRELRRCLLAAHPPAPPVLRPPYRRYAGPVLPRRRHRPPSRSNREVAAAEAPPA